MQTHLPCWSPLTTDSSKKLGEVVSFSLTRQRYASTGVSWSEKMRRHTGTTLAPDCTAAWKRSNSASTGAGAEAVAAAGAARLAAVWAVEVADAVAAALVKDRLHLALKPVHAGVGARHDG